MAGGYYWGSYVVPTLLAQPDDLQAWMELDAPPAFATAILRACTRMVLAATEGAFYATDPATGLATDETIVAPALQTATLIQAAAWVTLKIDPFAGGTIGGKSTVKSSTKIGTAAVVNADAADVAAARQLAATRLVPDAAATLQQANLLGTGPWTFG